MHLSGMEDVIIYLASNENERHFCMHVMEIISLMLREQNPASLAQAAAQRSVSEQQKDTEDLISMVQKETVEREARYKKMTASRSSIFRGTFCVKDVKSISDKDLIVHRTLTEGNPIDFNQNKKPKKKAKNRIPLPSCDVTRRSTLSIRLMLKEFCLQLLNGAYNSLMHIVKDCLVRMKAQEHDETYYLWALKFFMEFNRNSGKFRVELVSETMSVRFLYCACCLLMVNFNNVCFSYCRSDCFITSRRRCKTTLKVLSSTRRKPPFGLVVFISPCAPTRSY